MRSRPQVKLWHSPDVVPGSVLNVNAELRFTDETPVDFIDVKLSGVEFAGTGGGKTRQVANRKTIVGAQQFAGTTFLPGTYKYDVSFTIPMDAPPSHQGYDAHVRYELFMHVSIPWWPDRRATYAIPITFPRTPPYPPTPRVFSNRATGAGDDYPLIELSVDTTDVTQDETIRGQIAVADLGSRTCRGVDVAIVEMENLREPTVTTRVANRWARRIFHGRPPEGETIPFSVRVPAGAHPSFNGQLYGVRTAIEITCDIQLGSDVTIRAPLLVRPRLAEPREKSPELIAPVGNGRLDRVFGVVAGRLALQHEAGQRALRGTGGVVSFVIALEHRQDGYRRVAKYTYRALGVGFLVEQKGIDNLFGLKARAVPGLPGYVVSARDVAQVDGICECIGKRVHLFDHMQFGDDGAEISQKGDASTVESLSGFALKAIDFANALSDAIKQLPAPIGMQECVAAWQAFAERVGGDLSRPSMRIDHGRIGFDTLWVVTHFAVHGVPTDTVFKLALDPKIDLHGGAGLDSPNISQNARNLAAALKKTHGAEIATDRIAVSIPGAVLDPGAHSALVDQMAALANALRGQNTQAPYR
jgi:hypothetical protein